MIKANKSIGAINKTTLQFAISKPKVACDMNNSSNVFKEPTSKLLGVPNSLSEDLSEIIWNPVVNTTLSEDSDDIPMAYYYTTHSNFQAGADGGCLRCYRIKESPNRKKLMAVQQKNLHKEIKVSHL